MTKHSFFCVLCNENIEHEAAEDSVYEGIAASMEHFRVMHPKEYADIQTWPDGSVVVVDESLEPEDFDPPADADSTSK